VRLHQGGAESKDSAFRDLFRFQGLDNAHVPTAYQGICAIFPVELTGNGCGKQPKRGKLKRYSPPAGWLTRPVSGSTNPSVTTSPSLLRRSCDRRAQGPSPSGAASRSLRARTNAA
jgi:hypothetical protein